MPLTIRPATADDAAVVVEFNRLLALESEGKTLDLALLQPGVAAALADPGKCLYFLAEAASEIVGQVMITFEWSDWRNGWIWWVQSVYVRSDSRRQGVFRSLFEHVVATARQSTQVVGLRLYVEKDNFTAQKTYSRLGMQPTGHFVMEKYPL